MTSEFTIDDATKIEIFGELRWLANVIEDYPDLEVTADGTVYVEPGETAASVGHVGPDVEACPDHEVLGSRGPERAIARPCATCGAILAWDLERLEDHRRRIAEYGEHAACACDDDCAAVSPPWDIKELDSLISRLYDRL